MNGKVCQVIIDSGSTRTVSKKLVSTLNLTGEPHPNPYKVNWITKKGETTVKEICTVPLSRGNLYQDQIVCDVLDMDVCHLFLGRPWQYGKKTLHNGRKIHMNLAGWVRKSFSFPSVSKLPRVRYLSLLKTTFFVISG